MRKRILRENHGGVVAGHFSSSMAQCVGTGGGQTCTRMSLSIAGIVLSV